MAKPDRPSRKLPARPSLRFLKDEAKKRVKQGEFATLAEAQLAIAREHGFASWPRLKEYVDSISGATPDSRDQSEALLAAVKNGDMKKLRELVADGVDVDECEDQESALNKAAELGRSAMVKDLLEAGADPNFGGFLHVPLCSAAYRGHGDVVKILLAAGADVEQAEEEGITPLMSAASGGKLDVVKLLIEAGADPKTADDEGQTALDFAMSSRRGRVVEFLKHYATQKERASVARRSHLLREEPEKTGAAARNKPTPAKRAGKKSGPSPLIEALEKPTLSVEQFRQMLSDGADPNAIDSQGNTVLCKACGRCHHPGGSEIVQLLLQADTDVNQRGELFAPLHMAILNDSVAVVRMLLKAGAEVNATDFMGRTPVMLAAHDERLEVLHMLLDAGADVNASDDKGHNALWHALDSDAEEAASLLRGMTQDVESAEKPWRSDQFGTPELRLIAAADAGDLEAVRKLLKDGAQPDAGDEYADTAIHKAAEAGHLELVKDLLAAGVPAGQPGIGDRTALQAAASRGHLSLVEFLLQAGADVNAKDAYGHTPLWEAANGGHLPVLGRLLAAGAEVNVGTKGSHGTTPFLAAIGKDETHRRMMRLLVEHGADVRAVDQYGHSAVALAAGHLSQDDADARALREFLAELGVLSVDAGKLTTAAAEGDLDTVRKLIESGASPDAIDQQERTPLFMAVSRRHPEVAAYLLKAGADPNKAIGQDGEADTAWGGKELPCPKCKTAFVAIVNPRRCPQCGYRFDSRKLKGTGTLDLPLYVSWHNGFTPLMAAAKLGDAKLARMLIEAGARIEFGKADVPPLFAACFLGHVEVAKALIEKGADIKKVVKEPDGVGNKVTAVEIAAKAGHIELVEHLWAAGMPAKGKEQTLLVNACKHGNVKEIRTLLAGGADVNKPDPLTRDEPLETAAKAGHTNAVEVLLKAGAAVAQPVSKQVPPLISIAEKFQRGWVSKADQERYLAVAQMLLDAGARATVSIFGVTPLSLAEESKCKPLIEMLRAAAERETAAKKSKRGSGS